MSSSAAGVEGKTEEVGWCIEEDEAFEDALGTIPYPVNEEANVGSAEDRWLEAVASRIPGKTLAQVKKRYEILVEDVKAIEGDMVPTPPLWDVELSSSSPPRKQL